MAALLHAGCVLQPKMQASTSHKCAAGLAAPASPLLLRRTPSQVRCACVFHLLGGHVVMPAWIWLTLEPRQLRVMADVACATRAWQCSSGSSGSRRRGSASVRRRRLSRRPPAPPPAAPLRPTASSAHRSPLCAPLPPSLHARSVHAGPLAVQLQYCFCTPVLDSLHLLRPLTSTARLHACAVPTWPAGANLILHVAGRCPMITLAPSMMTHLTRMAASSGDHHGREQRAGPGGRQGAGGARRMARGHGLPRLQQGGARGARAGPA